MYVVVVMLEKHFPNFLIFTAKILGQQLQLRKSSHDYTYIALQP